MLTGGPRSGRSTVGTHTTIPPARQDRPENERTPRFSRPGGSHQPNTTQHSTAYLRGSRAQVTRSHPTRCARAHPSWRHSCSSTLRTTSHPDSWVAGPPPRPVRSAPCPLTTANGRTWATTGSLYGDRRAQHPRTSRPASCPDTGKITRRSPCLRSSTEHGRPRSLAAGHLAGLPPPTSGLRPSRCAHCSRTVTGQPWKSSQVVLIDRFVHQERGVHQQSLDKPQMHRIGLRPLPQLGGVDDA